MNSPTRTAEVVTELARLINVWRENGLARVRPAVLRHWARHTAARTSRPPAPELAMSLLCKLRLASVEPDGALAPTAPLRPAGPCLVLDRLDPPLNRVVLERMLELPSFAESIEAALGFAEVKRGVVAVSLCDLPSSELTNPAWLWLQHLQLAEHTAGELVLDPFLAGLVVTSTPAHRSVAPEELEERLLLQQERACLAEEYVVGLEKQRLRDAGAAQFVEEVTRVARVDVTAGYDILSFEVTGALRFVEVKSSAGRRTNFHLSRNEWEVASRERSAYWLAWVGWAMRLPHSAPEVAWFRDPFPLFDGSAQAWTVEPDGLLIHRVGDDSHLCQRVSAVE